MCGQGRKVDDNYPDSLDNLLRTWPGPCSGDDAAAYAPVEPAVHLVQDPVVRS